MIRSWVARSSRIRCQLGVRCQGFDRGVEQLLERALRVGRAGDHACLGVGVDGVDQVAHEVTHRHTGDGVQLGPLCIGQLELEGS